MRNPFLGTSKHTLENGNRIIIPSEFRKLLAPEFVLLKAPGRTLFIYLTETFDDILDEMNDVANTPEGLDNVRRFASAAKKCSLDKQGRFTIPSDFLTYAGLGNVVYLSGSGRRLEILSEEKQLARQAAEDCDVFFPVRY